MTNVRIDVNRRNANTFDEIKDKFLFVLSSMPSLKYFQCRVHFWNEGKNVSRTRFPTPTRDNKATIDTCMKWMTNTRCIRYVDTSANCYRILSKLFRWSHSRKESPQFIGPIDYRTGFIRQVLQSISCALNHVNRVFLSCSDLIYAPHQEGSDS